MPFNLLKTYNYLLDLDFYTQPKRKESLQRIFDRDFINSKNELNGKLIIPTPKDGITTMDVLLNHLTTKTENKDIASRIYDPDRSKRIHWIKHHFRNPNEPYIDIFSVKDKSGIRTYIFNESESYVIILEPKNKDTYFLITAYYIKGGDSKKIKSKKNRQLDRVY